jgi:hypothetical protein
MSRKEVPRAELLKAALYPKVGILRLAVGRRVTA